MNIYDIIIIGGGPAGLTAAIYALRAGKKVLVIEKATFGGQITSSPKVENIPGFVSVTGNEFAEKLIEQAMNLGLDVECVEALSFGVRCHDPKPHLFHLARNRWTRQPNRYKALTHLFFQGSIIYQS